ncbi:AhpC/TSA family protein [bacterium]|nr:MAG: AhpC/TSA family protein [bacterium]
MAILLTALMLAAPMGPSEPPKVGDKAPAFDVRTLDRKPVRLVPLLKQGPVVLVMLRGFPGYQCPLCTRQVGELFAKAEEFAKRKATVVLVYPGPSAELERRAGEFVAGKDIPAGFRFTIDPDYAFTKIYGLRWDADGETAYPSTFVIGRDGRIAYAKVSRSHGDRAPVKEILAALQKSSSSERS